MNKNYSPLTNARMYQTLLLFTVLGAVFLPHQLYPHGMATHQYIVEEAYNLLKLQFGGDLPIIKDYIGTTQGRTHVKNHPLSFQDHYVVAGAYQEDTYDAIWRLAGPGNSIVSATHFWDADKGDKAPVKWGNANNKISNWIDIAGDNNYPNALEKIRGLFHGGFHLWYFDSDNDKIMRFSYDNLIDFFKNGNITLHEKWTCLNIDPVDNEQERIAFLNKPSYFRRYVQDSQNKSDIVHNKESTTIETELGLSSNDVRYGIAFNILGRMAHLIGDMSVPAHVHNVQHACPADHYENVMRLSDDITTLPSDNLLDCSPDDFDEDSDELIFDQNPGAFDLFPKTWNAKSTIQKEGGFMDVYQYCNLDPLYLLLYTVNQSADIYAAANWVTGVGDGVSKDIGEISDHYRKHPATHPIRPFQYFRDHYQHEGPDLIEDCDKWPCEVDPFVEDCNCTNSDLDTNNLVELRNSTFPLAVRATAGLIYWFASETGILGQCNDAVHLTNINLDWQHYLFNAKSIYAGEDADLSIPIAERGKVIVKGETAQSQFIASEQVSLIPGFEATATHNGLLTFHAFIGDCSASSCNNGGGTNTSSGNSNSAKRSTSSNPKSLFRFKLIDQSLKGESSLSLTLRSNVVAHLLEVAISHIGLIDEDVTLSIYNAHGVLVAQQTLLISHATGTQHLSISVGDLPIGFYLIAVDSDSELAQKNFQVLR